MEKNIVIGIEGYVGAGKTSICKELLKRIPNSIIIHGGELYRTIVYALLSLEEDKEVLKQKLTNVDIKKIMDMLHVTIGLQNRETVFFINGTLAKEEEIESANASLAVSMIGTSADNSKLFAFARDLINNFKKDYHVILSGRALMQIYPDLDYHFLINASLEERVNRKYKQYEKEMTKEEVEKNIITRDTLQEKAGFYKKYPNTIEVDVTNCASAKISADKVMEHIKLPVNIH